MSFLCWLLSEDEMSDSQLLHDVTCVEEQNCLQDDGITDEQLSQVAEIEMDLLWECWSKSDTLKAIEFASIAELWDDISTSQVNQAEEMDSWGPVSDR